MAVFTNGGSFGFTILLSAAQYTDPIDTDAFGLNPAGKTV
jgi:hypothetical protein